MKIAVVYSTPMLPREGIGNHVLNTSRTLSKLGHQVAIFTRRLPGTASREEIDGLQIYRPFFLPLYPLHVHFHKLFLDRTINSVGDKFDLIHLHSPLVPPVRTRQPIVCTVHNPLKVDIRYVEKVDAFSLALRLQLPFSHHLERAVIAQSSAVTTVSASVAAELREYGLDPDRIAVLGTGVDLSLYRPAASPQGSYILYTGRLAYRKGLADLIDAMQLLKERTKTKLVLLGSGPLEERLRRQVARYGLQDHVEFYGHIIDKQRVADVFRNALVYVQPSWYEGLPVALLEAMACGIPVVATAVSGHLEVINSGENGLLVPSQEPPALAEAIYQLLEQPELRKQFAESGVELMRERFTWDKVIERTMTVYDQVLDGR